MVYCGSGTETDGQAGVVERDLEILWSTAEAVLRHKFFHK